jgi:hypothetical protein
MEMVLSRVYGILAGADNFRFTGEEKMGWKGVGVKCNETNVQRA